MVETLGDLGIVVTNDASPRVNERDITVAAEEFFRDATLVLDQASRIVTRSICPALGERDGRWHPSGFMIYPLGTHPELGTLRLHVWPRAMRRQEARPTALTRDIHDHVMHIASMVLAGEYSDTLYDVDMEGRSADYLRTRDEYRVYEPADDGPAAIAMRATPQTARAEPASHRRVRAGSVHTIEAGAFHVPTISEATTVATLVFSSPRVTPSGPHVLVAGDDEWLAGAARPVSVEEARHASNELSRA